MIIWINGAFGIGKTQTAYELNHRINNSFIYDPELVGFFLAKSFPPELRVSDFQNYPLWRKTVSNTLEYLQTERSKIIIAPMTIVSKEIYKEIVDPLKEKGIKIKQFTLIAKKETIQKRLKKRLDGNSWNYRQIDRCLKGLQDPIFEEFIDTDKYNLYEVVSLIGEKLNLELKAIASNRISRFFRRLKVTVSHIRT